MTTTQSPDQVKDTLLQQLKQLVLEVSKQYNLNDYFFRCTVVRLTYGKLLIVFTNTYGHTSAICQRCFVANSGSSFICSVRPDFVTDMNWPPNLKRWFQIYAHVWNMFSFMV